MTEAVRKELTIGELAERSGVAASTLRFYEREGLIHSRRTTGNQRRYTRETLRRVAFVRLAQRVGVSLAAIREALCLLPEGRTPTRADWAALSASWEEDLTHRITLLTELRDRLTGCIGCGCLSLDLCPIVNPNDHLAAEGPGPRTLTDLLGRSPGVCLAG
ncbi:redox-sensitive transcriptional activator SoxR [Actinocorallia sp. API 0066]|uniref:redox-sensitive transcriptional activator SoxR n=1 Tax=Actinocorallia sp. API 0066 TaxID=2896846 RepID=UPI001E49EC3A|nr:redox-sensitive transcriptional activator SoxR [Actinocorallia sp. API 0066]MCD0451238.1 redox-sensitive transcriptional activator SoxR [Actinocorallia sp. API 0066]